LNHESVVSVPGKAAMKRGITALLIVATAIASGSAFATNYTGVIDHFSINAAANGMTRVSVYVPVAVATCGNAYMYAFEFSGDTGPGKAMLAAVLAAKASGESIVISGNGACDEYNIEVMLYFEGH